MSHQHFSLFLGYRPSPLRWPGPSLCCQTDCFWCRSGETFGDLLNFSEPQFPTCKISTMMFTSQGQGKSHWQGIPGTWPSSVLDPWMGALPSLFSLTMAPFSRPYCSSTTGLLQTHTNWSVLGLQVLTATCLSVGTTAHLTFDPWPRTSALTPTPRFHHWPIPSCDPWPMNPRCGHGPTGMGLAGSRRWWTGERRRCWRSQQEMSLVVLPFHLKRTSVASMLSQSKQKWVSCFTIHAASFMDLWQFFHVPDSGKFFPLGS